MKKNCEICQDEQGYLITENGAQSWKICDCVKQRRIERLMKSSRLSEEFRKLTFDNYITDRNGKLEIAKGLALKYVADFESIRRERKNSIALIGQVGSGKTHLLCAVANRLLSSGIQVIYFPFVEGLNDLKANFEVIEEKADQLKRCEVLFIDDLFKGRDQPTNWQLETIYSIINFRYLNHLPILLTSEKSFDDLIRIDEATGSRIYEMSKNHNYTFKGQELNHRLK